MINWIPVRFHEVKVGDTFRDFNHHPKGVGPKFVKVERTSLPPNGDFVFNAVSTDETRYLNTLAIATVHIFDERAKVLVARAEPERQSGEDTRMDKDWYIQQIKSLQQTIDSLRGRIEKPG